MKRICLTYRMMAVFTACLMLVSSTGVAMDMHFCQDVLKSVRLIGEAPNCHEQAAKIQSRCHKKMEARSCHNTKASLQDNSCEKNCCSQEVFHARLDADFLKTETMSLEGPYGFVAMYVSAIVHAFQPDQNTVQDHYLDYKPPQPERNIPVLIQSFLF